MTGDDDPGDDDAGAASPRERAQSLRDALADAVDAPAQQDEQAARRRRTDRSNGEGADAAGGDDDRSIQDSSGVNEGEAGEGEGDR